MSDQQPAKPTLWQRLKTNTGNFFSHALGYIPRGIFFTGFAFAVSTAIETSTGFSGLGISKLSNPELMGRFLGHMALASTLVGTFGAMQAPCAPCAAGDGHLSGNPLLSREEAKNGQQLGQHLSQAVTDHGMQALAASSGLPTPAVPLLKSALGYTGLGK